MRVLEGHLAAIDARIAELQRLRADVAVAIGWLAACTDGWQAADAIRPFRSGQFRDGGRAMSQRASHRLDPELRAVLRDVRRTERSLKALAQVDDAAEVAHDEFAGVRDALEEHEAEQPKPQGC